MEATNSQKSIETSSLTLSPQLHKDKQPNKTNDESLDYKQQYLRENILDKNYEVEEFISYLNEKLNVDSDIEKCSIQDLQKVVKSFTKKVRVDQVHPSQIDHQSDVMDRSSYSSTGDNFFSSPGKQPAPRGIKVSSNPLIIEEQFTQKFKCVKIEEKYTQSELISKQIKCAVHSPQRKSVQTILGISSSSFLQFKVTTFGLGWQVGRRYSDFIWLRATLRKFNPSQIVPPIPNKKAKKRLPKHLRKRMFILSMFLNDLLKHPQFVNSQHVISFLSMQQNKFQAFKKQTDNRKSFEDITNTETLSGTVDVRLDKEILQYSDQLPNWVDKSQELLKQLTRQSKALQASTVEQVNTLFSMADSFASLHTITQAVHRLQKPINRAKKNLIVEDYYKKGDSDSSCSGLFKMKSIFTTLNNMMVEWGTILKQQIQLLQSNCNLLYKYVREGLSGYRELDALKSACKKEYIQAKFELDKKKQKLFDLSDITKWGLPSQELVFVPKQTIYERSQAFKLMLPKESAIVEKLKLKYCFYASRMRENANWHLSLTADTICSEFQEFTIKSKVLNQQMGELWNEMAFKFTQTFAKGNKPLVLRSQSKIQKESAQGDCEGDLFSEAEFSQQPTRK